MSRTIDEPHASMVRASTLEELDALLSEAEAERLATQGNTPVNYLLANG